MTAFAQHSMVPPFYTNRANVAPRARTAHTAREAPSQAPRARVSGHNENLRSVHESTPCLNRRYEQCTASGNLNNFSRNWSTFEALVNTVPWWRLLGEDLWQNVRGPLASSHAMSAATG